MDIAEALAEYRALKALVRGDKPPARGRTWRRKTSRRQARRRPQRRMSFAVFNDPIILICATKAVILGGGLAMLSSLSMVAGSGMGVPGIDRFLDTFSMIMCGVGTLVGTTGLLIYVLATLAGDASS